MKNVRLSLLLLINLLAVSAFSQTAQTETTFTVHASGFESNTGQAMLRLFRAGDEVPTKPFLILKVAIVNKDAVFTVKNLAYGDYAAIIVHDRNANGEIDHSFGMPSEPLGFSNNWELGLFSGMPTFEKLKFTFSKTNKSLSVNMDD
ncbi:MAG: DUF2141 domain-containing protein [Bacteroidota bacterium]